MNRRTCIALAMVGLCLMPHWLGAQEARLWRCGAAYADRPCDGGTQLRPAPPPSHGDRLASEAATRDARLAADRMERDRLRLEASQVGRGPVLIDASRSPRSQHAGRTVQGPRRLNRGSTSTAFKAQGPGAGKTPSRAGARKSSTARKAGKR